VKEKVLVIFACAAGLSAVFYGMAKGNDVVFIIGLLLVIGAYLVIRKRLKASLGGRRE
jgi:LPXTG-motif cell wall-anchored protein